LAGSGILAPIGKNRHRLTRWDYGAGRRISFLAVAAMCWGIAPALRAARLAAGSVPVLGPFAGAAPEELDPLDALERRLELGWKKALRRVWGKVVHGVALSTVIWLAALPLVALRFHLVSPISILLNLPLIPLTTAALMLAGLTLLLSAAWLPLGAPAA